MTRYMTSNPATHLPASILGKAHSKVVDAHPQRRLPDGKGDIKERLGQHKAPGWEEPAVECPTLGQAAGQGSTDGTAALWSSEG